MKTTILKFPNDQGREAVYLAGMAVNSLMTKLPVGTAYAIGMVLMVMMTGRLSANKGSLASAVYPLVMGMKWGWHRVERALERGKVNVDDLFDKLVEWCVENLEVEEVRVGKERRKVEAVDSTTIARWRAGKGLKWIGKGYCGRVGKAVKANVAAVVTRVVMVKGMRVGLVRRVRFGETSEEAVKAVIKVKEEGEGKRVVVVDAGIATYEQFSEATETDALVGRLRRNCVLADPKPGRTGKRGRPRKQGEELRPGAAEPGREADERYEVEAEDGRVLTVRRWRGLILPDFPACQVEVVRVDDPNFKDPLLIGCTAQELETEEIRLTYRNRWPVETNFFVGQNTTAMETPRAWQQTATERRIGLALLAGSLLQMIAAQCEAIPTGPWDRHPTPSAGRLARLLDASIILFSEVALKGVGLRNYRKNPLRCIFNKLQKKPAA
jgi:hypothetical protein